MYDSIILEIREKANIIEVVSETVNLKPAGATRKGLCPFHSERSPSFTVSEGRQMFKCFGCGAGGDVFSFVQQRDGVGFVDAAKILAKKFNVEWKPNGQPVADFDTRTKITATLAAVQSHFLRLDDNPAIKYWKDRKFSDETITEFGLGYCDETKVPLIEVEQTEQAGISNDKGNISFFKRATIPLHDASGNFVGFAGRTLDKNDDGAKYINNRNTAAYQKSKFLFNLHRAARHIRTAGEVWICEGYADAMAAHQMGVKNIVAVSGLAFTDDHVAVLKKFNGEKPLRFVLCLDNEIFIENPKENTVQAYTSALQKLLPLGEVQVLEYPKRCKDIGEVLERGDDLQKLKKEDAILKFFYSRWDKSKWVEWSAYKKAEFQELFANVVSKVKNTTARDSYINDITATLSISPKKFEDLVKEKNSSLRDAVIETEAEHIWIADDIYERQIDFDIHTKTSNIVYLRRSKDTLKLFHGTEYLRKIPRFDNWFCEPAHANYRRTIQHSHGGVFNKFFNSYHPLPYKPQPFDLPAGFDDPEFVFEDIPQIRNTVNFLKHAYNVEKYGEKFFRLGLDYLTILFKHPARRLQARAFVSTEEGTGKSTVIDWETAIWGQNATKSTTDKITQKFNSLSANKLLIAVEETKDDRLGLENILKDLITGLQKVVEYKGKDAVTVRSFDKYVFCSNHPESFMKVGDATTRFAVVDVPVLKQRDNFFLEKLIREIPYLLHFLEKRQIWTPDTDRLWFSPVLWENEALIKLRQASKDQIIQSIEELMATIWLKTKIIKPVLRFSSSYLKNVLSAWGGKHLERTPTQITAICTERMRLFYAPNSTRFGTYKINGVSEFKDLNAMEHWETTEINDSGRYIEFPIWKFLKPADIAENYNRQQIDELAAAVVADKKLRERYGLSADDFISDMMHIFSKSKTAEVEPDPF